MIRAPIIRNLLMALPALLLWLLLPATAGDPVLGAGLARQTMAGPAILATALLLLVWLAQLVLAFVGRGHPVTGFQRVVVHAVLGFAISFVTLRLLGFQLGAILTTSALVTAAIGFAMQPTLSSVIAGLALEADRELHIGDTVMQDGMPVRITALGWRAAVGRRGDGTVVVMPNARLSDNVLEILPGHQSLRLEMAFPAPATGSPQAICALAGDVASRLPGIDPAQPLEVLPETLAADGGIGQYRLRLWQTPPYDKARMQSLFVQRFWLACRRHGLAPDDAAGRDQDLQEAVALLRLPAAAGNRLAKEARVLPFAPGEPLVLPPAYEGARFLLLRGGARDAGAANDGNAADAHVPAAMAAARLTALLARAIGPYAQYAVAKACRDASDRSDLARTLAQEIPDDADRARFLAEAGGGGDRLRPGAWLTARRGAAGLLVCEGLEADGETAILAIPADLPLTRTA